MSPLPNTNGLVNLVTSDTSDVNSASASVAAGAAAAARLSFLRSQLDDALALQAQCNEEVDDGADRLTDAQNAANELATAAAAAITAITAAAPGGLANVPWKAAVTLSMTFPGITSAGTPGAVTGSYTSFASDRAAADADLLAKQNTVIANGIDAEHKKQLLDAALAALANFIKGVETDLANAQQYFNSAGVLVTARSYAGAWWSWFLGDALVSSIDSEDDTALINAVTTTADAYGKAMTLLKTSTNVDLAKAVAAQSRTAYNLGIADAKVRAALAATPPV